MAENKILQLEVFEDEDHEFENEYEEQEFEESKKSIGIK